MDAVEIQVESLLGEVSGWAGHFSDIRYPWLCWNIQSDWCYVQQRLVSDQGWTPVVGFDPRVGPPRRVASGARVIDFNQVLGLPLLQFQFVVEFAFLFCERLAFWHSDLLCRPRKMARLAERFRRLDQGAIAMVDQKTLKQRVLGGQRRFFELAGCVTRDASRHNFETGCGIWRNFAYHPNCPSEEEFVRRRSCYWDHGSGVKYWRDHYGGPVDRIPEWWLNEGHFSRLRLRGFKPVSSAGIDRHSGHDLEANVDLRQACAKLGLKGYI